jgi:hypothetical protein
MSTLAPQDSVGSLHADAYREARDALQRLNTGRDWSDWQKVGAALVAGRAEAMRTANTNRPKGRRYNEAFGAVLKREQLGTDRLDSATRNQLLRIEENKAAIEEWRATLTPAQRVRLNHPSSIWRHWQRAVKGGAKHEQSNEVEQSAGDGEGTGTISIITALTTLVQQMGEHGFTPQLDNMLAANLSFTSNDLIELAAQLQQLATAWEEHPTRSRESDQQERQAMSTGCAGGGQSSAARSD